ncbi:MAG: hypothetical protein WCF85_20245 [Rhodospirillaceae bacterium]
MKTAEWRRFLLTRNPAANRQRIIGILPSFCRFLVALLMTLPSGLAAAGEMIRTAPGHLLPPYDEFDPERLAPTRLPSTPQIVVRSKKEWRTSGTMNRALTEACRAGRFKERLPLQYRAIFSDAVLGVAFGHGTNLYDPGHKGKTDTVYMFRYGDTTDCEVLTIKKSAMKKL